MPFPFSITGLIEVMTSDPSGVAVEEVAEHVEWLLDDARAKSVSRIGPRVVFRGGSTAPWFNMGVLAAIDAGRICVKKQGASILVEYELSEVRFLKILVALSLLPFGWTLLSASTWSGNFYRNVISTYSDRIVIMLIVALWLWLFLISYLLTRFIFREWLVRRLGEAFPSARAQAVRR
jgi:hypothetical protein